MRGTEVLSDISRLGETCFERALDHLVKNAVTAGLHPGLYLDSESL